MGYLSKATWSQQSGPLKPILGVAALLGKRATGWTRSLAQGQRAFELSAPSESLSPELQLALAVWNADHESWKSISCDKT